MKVVSITPRKGNRVVAVYDITVARTHLYFMGGVLVSNSKRVSMLDVNALMSHGAIHTLVDKGVVRGQSNPQRWLQFMQGHNPTHVKIPRAWEKFVNTLRGSGINVVEDGPKLHLMAMANHDVHALAGDRVMESGDTVRFDKQLKPIPGGLFDPQLTGGHNGRQWAKIPLHEPMVNPVMEEPVRRLLGITGKEFEGTISGDHQLGKFGTGPQAIAKALDSIDVGRELTIAREQVKHGRGSKRDQAVRRLGYLKAAEEMKMHPRDWVLDHVPVLPPIFRPVSIMGNTGIPLVSDANYLYKELIEANSNLKGMKKELGEAVGPERLATYHALKAVTGLGDPIQPKLQQKNVKGLLKSVFGSSPKFGTVQRKLLSSTVDNVGRAVISPNPDLDMDSVGIPENTAFDVYSKFIVRRLHRKGMPISQAMEEVKSRSDKAREAIQEEMDSRPVFINRAPVLHKFGIMAFRPRIAKGDVMQVSPLIVKGFNADFDGDAMQFHIPSTDEAVQEAYERMLPSKNLLSPADFKSPVHVPGQEYLAGLHRATHDRKDKHRVRTFRNEKDLQQAFARGEVTHDTPVRVLED